MERDRKKIKMSASEHKVIFGERRRLVHHYTYYIDNKELLSERRMGILAKAYLLMFLPVNLIMEGWKNTASLWKTHIISSPVYEQVIFVGGKKQHSTLSEARKLLAKNGRI